MGTVQYGLKNIHLFPLTETTDDQGKVTMSFGAGVAFPGAVNLNLSKETGESTPFYADDGVYFLPAEQPKGYSGTLETALLSTNIRTAFMNYIKDAADAVVELGEAQTKHFALTCEKTTNSGFIKKVFYKCAFGAPDFSAATTEDAITPETESIPITILPTAEKFEYTDSDNVKHNVPVISAYVDETGDATVISSWHTTPHLPDFDGES